MDLDNACLAFKMASARVSYLEASNRLEAFQGNSVWLVENAKVYCMAKRTKDSSKHRILYTQAIKENWIIVTSRVA